MAVWNSDASAAVPAPTQDMTDSIGVAPDGASVGTAEVTAVFEAVSEREGVDPVVVLGAIGVRLGCDRGCRRTTGDDQQRGGQNGDPHARHVSCAGPTRRI